MLQPGPSILNHGHHGGWGRGHIWLVVIRAFVASQANIGWNPQTHPVNNFRIWLKCAPSSCFTLKLLSWFNHFCREFSFVVLSVALLASIFGGGRKYILIVADTVMMIMTMAIMPRILWAFQVLEKWWGVSAERSRHTCSQTCLLVITNIIIIITVLAIITIIVIPKLSHLYSSSK